MELINTTNMTHLVKSPIMQKCRSNFNTQIKSEN